MLDFNVPSIASREEGSEKEKERGGTEEGGGTEKDRGGRERVIEKKQKRERD